MTVSNKPPRVFQSLMRHPHIRAVVLINQRGDVKARRGQARSLQLDAQDPTVVLPIDTSASKPEESIYICEFDDDDFLIIIFDEDAEFETLKDDIDATLNL